MNTDELIATLVSQHRQVDARALERALAAAATGSFVVALAAIGASIGLRSDLWAALIQGHLAVKYLFVVTAVAVSATAFLRLARPGQALPGQMPLLGLPLTLIVAAAAIEWAVGSSGPDRDLVLGGTKWLACIVLVPAYAVIPFTAFVWVLRRGAPTDLRGAGFATGVVSATVAAAAYAAHCPCDSPYFVAIWYPVAFCLSGLAGSRLVPALVRW